MEAIAEPAVELKQALDKIRHQVSSKLVNQKRPASLLVAIETTLNEQGTALAPVAYFAALLSTIQQLAANAEAIDSDGETLPAALYLFAIVLPCTSGAVVKSRSGTLIEVFGPLMAVYNDQAAAMKSLLTILQFVYINMDNSALTGSLPAKQVFNTILALLVDPRPKVRRKAQEVVQVLLANPPAPSIRHPYATRVADFVIESLKEALKEGKKGGKKRAQEDASGSSPEVSRAIGLCAFIKMAGKDWPSSYIAPLCSLLLSLPRLSNTFLTTASYDILETLFSKSSDSFEEGKVEETLEAVLAAKPTGSGSVEERILPGWLGTVEHGFVAFSRSNPERCTAAVYSTFNGVLSYLASPAMPVRTAGASTLKALLRYCVTNEEIAYAAAHANVEKQDSQTHPLSAISETLLLALKNIKYQAMAMPHLLSVVAAFIARLRFRIGAGDGQLVPAASILSREHVKIAGQLRGVDNFEFREGAELVLGTATEVCGPEWILSLLPLNLDDTQRQTASEPGRAWLLPILKSKITNTRLSHFTTYFVPLSEAMFGKLKEAEAKAENAKTDADKKRLGIQAKVFEALVQQIWALFPGYCNLPVDLAQAFTKQFCEMLANVLYSQGHLRPAIFRGLQLLVERNKSLMASASPSEMLIQTFGIDAETGKQNIQLLSGLAPNLLAVMFNVFSKAGKEGRGYVLDGISAYLSILSAKDLVGTFNKLKSLLLQALPNQSKAAAGETTVPQTMLDFLVQLVPFLPDQNTASELLKLVTTTEVLQNKDTAVQKKAYRALVRMCESNNAVGERCIRDNIEQVVEELIEKNHNVAASAKKDRIVLLATIIPILPADKLHVIPSIIPEAVLSTKEANEATRAAAYDLLVGMAEKMAKGGVIKRDLIRGAQDMQEDEEDAEPVQNEAEASIQEYITMVAAGLVGTSPHMISATITALSRLLFEYHEQLPSSTINDMLSTMLIFLGSANREIVKSAIGFVKVAVVGLAPVDVQPHLAELVPALFNWSHEHANHFKANIRHILERMIRKFGYDEIEALTPEKDRKLLVNIKKRQQRAKRKKEEADENEQEGSDDEKAQPRTSRNAYEDALYGSEDEDDVSDAEEAPAPAQAQANKRPPPPQGLRKNAIGRRKDDPPQQERPGESYITEGDDPLDLLDEKMLGRISRKDPRAEEARRAKREEASSSRFKTDSRGKLIFNDEDGDGGASGGEGDDDGMDATGAYLEAINGEDGFQRTQAGKIKFNKPTKRGRAQMEEDELVADVKDRLEGLGMLKDKTKKQKKVKESIGQEFKAKKAGGDIKKDGVSPYAYVPLGNGKKRSNLSIVGKGKRR